MNKLILVVNKVPSTLIDVLSEHYSIVYLSSCDEVKLADIAVDIEVIVASGESTVSAKLINTLPNLKLISVFGVGYDGVDIESAFAKNIQITNTPDVLTDDVADLGIGLMIATARQIPSAQRFIEKNKWSSSTYNLTTKVSGSKIGIIGLGRVGQAIAKRANAFNMSICYFDKKKIDSFPSYQYFDDIIKLAQHVDFLIVCANANSNSKRLVNADVLKALGSKGIIVNIARGSIIDETALVEAIKQKVIAGAGLDVFDNEPNIPKELLQLDNVVLTPHIASATIETREKMKELVVNNIKSFFENKPLLTPIRS